MRPEYELNEQFANSDYGVILENSVRFGTFKPDFLANEEWVEILGEDVNNRTHMMRAYKLTRWFVNQQPDLSEVDKETLCLSAMVHDWGEAIVGDTPDPLKTAAGEELERKAWIDVADSMLGLNKTDELAAGVWPVVFPAQPTKLSKMWRTIENMGYLETAVKAAREAAYSDVWAEKFGLNEVQGDILLGSLRSLASQVTARCLENLEPLCTEYPAVERFLYGRRDRI